MFNLIVIGVVLAVMTAVGIAARTHFVDIGVAKVQKQYAALIKTCGERDPADCANEWTDAMAKNRTLAADVTRIDRERQLCSEGVKKQGELQAVTDAEKEKNVAKAMTLVASAQAEAAKQRALASQPPKPGVTCEQRLQAVDASLDELAARQLRFNPSGPVGGGSENAPAGSGAGASPVRIRQ